jgi:hypothetical protein
LRISLLHAQREIRGNSDTKNTDTRKNGKMVAYPGTMVEGSRRHHEI